MKGSVLQQFLDLTAARGGWPVAGITMHIKDNKAVDVMINGSHLTLMRLILLQILILLPMVVIMQICYGKYLR
jgi:hypothetical protein